MRVVLTGGAGFLGSHLVDALLARGDEVVVLDSLVSGQQENVDRVASHPGYSFFRCDVSEGIDVDGAVDAVMHFASPASPPHYLEVPFVTLRVGSLGTFHAADLALRHGARFMVASTSEVYGDPHVHPQPETYWGNVNPIGPRSVYDESKRFMEAVTAAYRRTEGVDTCIVRYFNTYGPRMRANDGRVVSNFVVQALRGAPLTVFGDGTQTRSFGYVSDSVDATLSLLDSGHPGPMNVGNPGEFTMLELAELVLELTGSSSSIVHEPLPIDDPTQRKPDIALATEVLGWEPKVSLREGLIPTIKYFAEWCDTHD
jgi:dTDP-glucose 4,6-dehydratase